MIQWSLGRKTPRWGKRIKGRDVRVIAFTALPSLSQRCGVNWGKSQIRRVLPISTWNFEKTTLQSGICSNLGQPGNRKKKLSYSIMKQREVLTKCSELPLFCEAWMGIRSAPCHREEMEDAEPRVKRPAWGYPGKRQSGHGAEASVKTA